MEELCREKIQVSVDADFMDIYILTLNEELTILKEFEATEEVLQQRVHHRLEELLDMQDVMQERNNKIQRLNREIKTLQIEENDIRDHFFVIARDNKFYDFLRRIFKKKYRPPKVYNPDGNKFISNPEIVYNKMNSRIIIFFGKFIKFGIRKC